MKKTTFFILTVLVFSTIGLQTALAQVTLEHGSGVTSVAFSLNGSLASGAADGTVKLWDVATNTNVATLDEHTGPVWSVSFSPNGMLLASGSADGTVKLWDVGTHTNIATLEEHTDAVASVAFSPDGTILASGAGDGVVKLWNVETHQNTATFGGHDASILEEGGWFTPVSFLSNTTLVSGAGDSIKLWDVETHQNTATLGEDLAGVVSLSFSRNGTTLASGAVDSIKLWDVVTRTNSATFPSVSARSLFPLIFTSFSPDGMLIASTLDENVVLWDVETSTQINTLLGHTDAVRSVSFSPDGALLASGALDGTVRLWDMSSLEEPLVASAEFPLTEANLHGSIVTLTLNGRQFADEWVIRNAVSLSGIDGVTINDRYIDGIPIIDRYGVERVSDTEVTVELEFDGTDFDTDATLTFTVDAWATVGDYDQVLITPPVPVIQELTPPVPVIQELTPPVPVIQELTAQVPVTAIQKSNATVSLSPASVVSPAVEDELTFSFNIKGGENVAGYQATVSFDRTALRPVDFTNGDYLPADAFVATPIVGRTGTFLDEGSLEVSVTLTANTLAGASNGDGALATLTFKLLDFKASTLTLSKVYLVDPDGTRWEAITENAEVTVPAEPAEEILGDINRDGVVNIQDLAIVGARYGQRGQDSADINGDRLVDIVDLVLVANAFGEEAAAPSAQPQALELLTAADVQGWLSQAQQLALTDSTYLHGITVLEQLLAALIPKETILLPNYPNPFNPETWIPYRLADDALVTLTIYNQSGQIVRTLDVGHRIAAFYESRSKAIHWDGRNEFGEQVTSSVYFYHLSAGDYSATRKMLILK